MLSDLYGGMFDAPAPFIVSAFVVPMCVCVCVCVCVYVRGWVLRVWVRAACVGVCVLILSFLVPHGLKVT